MNLIKFFKKNYALQNIKKSKGILAIMLIVIPVITLFCLHSVDSSGYGDPYAVSVAMGANFCGLIVIPFVLTNILFGYVYKKNSIDFINSMPISRKNLYFTNILVGILYVLILQGITWVSSSIYILSIGDSLFTIKFMFDIAMAMSLAYIFLFVCSTLALSVSGNVFTQLVVLALVLFTIPFIRAADFGDFVEITNTVFLVNNDGSTSEYWTENESVFAMPITTFLYFVEGDRVLDVKSSILTLFLTILYTFIGYKLFDKRKMENTGNSFEKEKIHLLVKGITVYPVIVFLQRVDDSLEIPQLLLILFVLFVYYFVYDFITSKKVKFKTTCISFVVTCSVLVLITLGLTKTSEFIHSHKDYYYADEIKGMEVRLSEIFYGNMSFGEIKDESLRNKILDQITSKTNRYSHTGEVSFVEIIKDQYSYNKNHSIEVKCKFDGNDEIKMFVDIDDSTYINLLNYILNDEECLNSIVKKWELTDTSMIELRSSSSQKIFKGDAAKEIKEVVNKNLEKNIRNKIENALKEVTSNNNYIVNDHEYWTIDRIDVYKYEDFEVKNYTIEFDIRSEIANVVYEKYNEEALDDINEYLEEEAKRTENFDGYTSETNGNIIEYSNNSSESYADIYDMNVLLIKEYIEKYGLPKLDLTKDFYKIQFYSFDCDIFVNSIDDFERTVPGVSKRFESNDYPGEYTIQKYNPVYETDSF